VPLVGPFHTRWPLYSAVHVREIVRAFAPARLVLASLPPGALADPLWQDTEELALPLAVVPWALKAGIAITAAGLDPAEALYPGDDAATADLFRYLGQYEAGRSRLAELNDARAPFERLLVSPMDCARLTAELLPALAAFQREQARLLGEGPGTGWHKERAELLASRVLAASERRAAVLVALDLVPALQRALAGHAELEPLAPAVTGEEGRRRALLDLALRGETADPAALLAQLAQLAEPEARYHEANLLLATGHVAAALGRLEELTAGDFAEPYFLPGFALARLGQLHDLTGKRQAAIRSYRGALALSYAPLEAREAARRGLEAPFAFAGEPEGGSDRGII